MYVAQTVVFNEKCPWAERKYVIGRREMSEKVGDESDAVYALGSRASLF
jgi:hypothetical protein